jgi:hypothetical protein
MTGLWTLVSLTGDTGPLNSFPSAEKSNRYRPLEGDLCGGSTQTVLSSTPRALELGLPVVLSWSQN